MWTIPRSCGSRTGWPCSTPVTTGTTSSSRRRTAWQENCGLQPGRDPDHVSPEWPKGYWPKPDELGNPTLWQQTIDQFRNDLQQMEALVEDPATDLHAKIEHGDGQTILREALLIADHNAYHLGVLAVMARIAKTVSK